jgi:hypothetical protein
MSTTNFSASLTTARRRQLTNYGWALNDNYPANPVSTYPFQREAFGAKNNGPSAEMVQSVVQGAILSGQPNTNVYPDAVTGCPTACTAGVTLQGFVRNSPANSKSLGGSSST